MKRVSKNFLALFFSDGITRLIGFAATVYIARMLAVEGFGLINYGLAFISYALLFANPGLTVIGAREVAKAPQNRRFIEETIGLRVVLAIIIFVIFFAVTSLVPGDRIIKQIILVYALTLFPCAVLLEFVFQGREEMAYIGVARIIQYCVYLGVLLLFLKSAHGILVVPFGFVIGYVTATIFLICVFVKKYRSFQLRFSVSQWRVILTAAVPVGLAIIFNQVTISLPAIVLGVFKTNYEVGIYSAGYKIVFMLLIVERVFYYVFFPILSKQHRQNPEKLASSFNFLTRFLFALTIPIAVGGLMLAPGIINLIYGRAFVEAINVFRILLIYFLIVPVNTIFGYGLIAIEQERRFFKIITITAIISAVLIVLLGLQFGFYGAAAALLISEFISIMLMRRQLKKFVRFGCMKYILKPAIAALLMALLLYILPQWHVFILIVCGTVGYSSIFYSVKGFSKLDLDNLKRIIVEK